ncbi:Vacuolar calcium ion transporter [Grifola frondosa]|uniref:Vacuolar calcium ion transporter n=1 Tax=Grifola frondosa TaxID=5627 RepID=A0A1C7M8N0_GRIFR|nr:Vacuolar calcium ion transporter [Grifola frondosa]
MATTTDEERGYASAHEEDMELQHLHHSIDGSPDSTLGTLPHTRAHSSHEPAHAFWDRVRGRGRRSISWRESGRNVAMASSLNVLLLLIPFAWASHFHEEWGHTTTFVLCFLAIIPLENLFDYGGEQMALYLGKDLGDLLVVTLNKLRLLQSTIVGVVILHLLLVPGTAFLVGGAKIWEQSLHPHHTQLNQSLLVVGISVGCTTILPILLNDSTRDQILRMSRGLSVILLVIYVGSRVFLHNPPGKNNALKVTPDAPKELKHEEKLLKEEVPEVGPLACLLLLIVTVGIMAFTAECFLLQLVESINDVKETSGIKEEWFGLILLPIVSFSADGAVAIIYFSQSVLKDVLKLEPLVPSSLARARAIDLSIQFTLWWMPFLVLLGWWISRPIPLLFGESAHVSLYFFEVALLLGACFLVNYVTADAKTNWVEAICSWFYTGQPELAIMLTCRDTVAAALLTGGKGIE